MSRKFMGAEAEGGGTGGSSSWVHAVFSLLLLRMFIIRNLKYIF